MECESHFEELVRNGEEAGAAPTARPENVQQAVLHVFATHGAQAISRPWKSGGWRRVLWRRLLLRSVDANSFRSRT